MKSWKRPTDKLLEKALASVRKDTDRQFFFPRLKNPLWLQPLIDRAYFESPPQALPLEDGQFHLPFWPELEYLKNISHETPDQVVGVIRDLPKVDNPRIYDQIVEIALALPGSQSAQLKGKILEGLALEVKHFLRTFDYENLLNHWTAAGETTASLDLARMFIAFRPDPKATEKRKGRKDNLHVVGTILQPSPRIGNWEYRHFLEDGVKPLAQKVPYEVACLLLNATADMIKDKTHENEQTKGGQDYSEIWCPRVAGSEDDRDQPEEALIHTMTFACEIVFQEVPSRIADLYGALKSQHWYLFARLRQHILALNPTEQTKPWIRELILGHTDYKQWEHHYEFQQMVRAACDCFGADLLTENERRPIFDAILSGPSKQRFRDFMGDKFTEASFDQRQAHFHKMQFRPFSRVLFGKYLKYYHGLEGETGTPTSDEDYSPYIATEAQTIHLRSPRSVEDLAQLSDHELLAYINQWDGKRRADNDWFVEINVEALAEAFQTLFANSIVTHRDRFRFWLENRENIERPIYVRKMIAAMQERIKKKEFDKLAESLSFCEWVLSHPDQEPNREYRSGDESSEKPNWHHARRSVGDLIGICLDRDVDVPLASQAILARLLEILCTQFDWRLDTNRPLILNKTDLFAEAINNTRASALGNLIKFGFWLTRNGQGDNLSFVRSILESRFSQKSGYPLKLPERALLGVNYTRMLSLDPSWSADHKSDFFPQGSLSEWRAAFSNFLRYSPPTKLEFDIIGDDLEFALRHLAAADQSDEDSRGFTEHLGQRLFTYYMWGFYQLRGKESLIERFYEATDGRRERWANLFDYVGTSLHEIDDRLADDLRDKIVAFFDWRLQVKETKELVKFSFWLQAECLEAEWRLSSFSKVLDVCQDFDVGDELMFAIHMLPEMLPKHVPKVVECFAKLTDHIDQIGRIIPIDAAKQILETGLESGDEGAQKDALRAKENLVSRSYFDLLDLAD